MNDEYRPGGRASASRSGDRHPLSRWPVDRVDARASFAIELACSLLSLRFPREFNQTATHRGLADAVGPAGMARLEHLLPDEDVEQASVALLALRSLFLTPGPPPREAVSRAFAERSAGLAELVDETWYDAFLPVWRELEPGLVGVAEAALHAAVQPAYTAGESLVDLRRLVPDITGCPLLPEQAKALEDFPEATITLIASHFFDPSPGFVYGPARSFILFSAPGWVFRTGAAISGGPVWAGSIGTQQSTGGARLLAERTASELAVPLRLLADPTRLGLVALLAARPMYASQLAKALGVTQPAVSYHLKALSQAGLVELAPTGPYTFARVRREGLQRVADNLASLAAWAGGAASVEDRSGNRAEGANHERGPNR